MNNSERSSGSESSDRSIEESTVPHPHARDTAAQLLEQMNARGGASPLATTKVTPPTSTPPLKTQSRLRNPIKAGEPCTKEEMEEVRKEMALQEQIITTLQHDNESLRASTRQLKLHTKEAESKLANLEAKRSLMQSATESGPVDNSVEIRKLAARNKELQHSLEEAEMATLSAKSEVRQLLDEIEKAALREADLHTALLERKRGEMEHQKAVEEYKRLIAELSASKSEEVKASTGKVDTSVASIEHVEIQQAHNDGHEEIEELRAHVKNLEAQLESQRKTALQDLIKAVQPDGGSRSVKRLESRVQQLEAALNEKEAGIEQVISRLRSDADEVRSSYEDRIRQLESQLRQKDHELRRAQSTALASSSTGAPAEKKDSSSNTSHNSNESIPGKQVRFVVSDLITKEQETTKSRTTALEDELESYRKLAKESHALLQRSNEAWEKQNSAFKEDFLQQLRSLRQKHNEDIDRLQRYHKDEMSRALEEVAELKKVHLSWKPPQLTAKTQLASEKGKTFLESVVERLSFLEKHCLQREREATFAIEEAKRLALAEQRLQGEKYEILLSQKNQQINQFRMELDDIISSVACLRHTSRF